MTIAVGWDVKPQTKIMELFLQFEVYTYMLILFKLNGNSNIDYYQRSMLTFDLSPKRFYINHGIWFKNYKCQECQMLWYPCQELRVLVGYKQKLKICLHIFLLMFV